MNPNLIVTKSGYFRFFSQRKTIRENFRLGINTTYILALLFIGLLGTYYVWTLNINATKGYNIRNLEMMKNNLSVEKELIEVKIAEYESLSNLTKWSGINNMVKVEGAQYLVVKDMKDYAFKN